MPSPTLPIITVVTPSYNQAAYLEATLRSVLDQQYPFLRLIVMDGGSTDGSAAILERYTGQISHWVSEKDGGQSDAINKGFAWAAANPTVFEDKGGYAAPDGRDSRQEILTWLNSDDVLLPGALAAVGRVFGERADIAWLTGQPAKTDVRDQVRLSRLKTGYFRALIRRGWYHGRGLGFIRQEGTFWRRSLWEQVKGIDAGLHYAMDFDLWRQFAAVADLVAMERHLAAFRIQPEQKTAAINKYYAEAGIRLPHAARVVTLPLRVAFTVVGWPFAPKVR